MVHVLHQPRQQQYLKGEVVAPSTGPIGLVLVPTRELALQVNKVFQGLFKAANKASNNNEVLLLLL